MAQPRATRPSRSIRHTNSGATNPSRFVIGTFNVRGFNSATKRDQLSDDLGRLHVDVCCLQETKCPDGFDERCGNYRHIGMPSQSRHYGLAFSVSMQLENQIIRYWSVSDRIAVIQLRISNNSISLTCTARHHSALTTTTQNKTSSTPNLPVSHRGTRLAHCST